MNTKEKEILFICNRHCSIDNPDMTSSILQKGGCLPVSLNNVAKYTRQRRSLPIHLLWKKNNSWPFSRCHNIFELNVLSVC
jgi:hypothetical protein